MAKALFVTYLIALSAFSIAGYSNECTIGPEHWCKSFDNAQDCGALKHCTDTVWGHDNKYTSNDDSAECKWCQKILENTHKGLNQFIQDEKTILSTLTSSCNLLFPTDVSSKCSNTIEKYGSSAITLMQNKRYTTLCLLMDVCTRESVTEKPPIVLGSEKCTWGPSYWCSSLSNTRECNSIDHCSKRIWSQQTIESKENDNICQYCQQIIKELRSILTENRTETDIEKWLSDACLMLKTKDKIDECVKDMSQYGKEILVLVENNIDPGIICHLGQMCKDATILVRDDQEPSVDQTIEDKTAISFEDQSKILCNVIVRATHDLHVNEGKTQNDIQMFLRDDCQKLTTDAFRQKCANLVDKHVNTIYLYVVKDMELSTVCENLDLHTDEFVAPVDCQLCTNVLTTAKQMLDTENSEDKVLQYMDEKLCSNGDEEQKRNCKFAIEINGQELIYNIKRGTKSLLLCNYFQVCYDEMMDRTSSIKKDEMRLFLKEHICDRLGPFESTCNELMKKDSTRVLKTLIDNMEGDVLCRMFGICKMKMSLTDNLSVGDGKNACQRCIVDFTRRKHIAERLLNHSSDFLHHLCGQLPQKDECTKAVDESINTLVQFIQSLNPQGICTELKVCTEDELNTIEPFQITPSDNIISQEIMLYVKDEICSKLGPLSKLCHNIVDSEGPNALALLAKGVDPHRVCNVIDVCPKTTAFNNCNDPCTCCQSKMENYQVQMATFLQTMLAMNEAICEQIPNSQECRLIADLFKSNIDTVINQFNSKRICEMLTHCSTGLVKCDMENDQCKCCQDQLNTRQNNFRIIMNEGKTNLVSLCTDDNCRSSIQSNYQQLLDQINQMNSLTTCQRFGPCTVTMSLRTVSRVPKLIETNLETMTDNICSQFVILKTVCEHIMVSRLNVRYNKVYLALINNNRTIIDNDLLESKIDNCEQCESVVKSAKDFWTNALKSAHDALLPACEVFPVKDQCQDILNKQFNSLVSYIDAIKPEQVCQQIHLCSVASLDQCSTCIERLQLRNDAFLQAINRLTEHFKDWCQRRADEKCQIYVQQMHDIVQISLEEFDLKETCNAMGFCTKDNSEMKFDVKEYEKQVEEEIDKEVCSLLGPFGTLCKSIIHGDMKQIQEMKINYNFKDFKKVEQQLTEYLSETQDFDETAHDKCKVCIFRVIQRKRHMKFIGDHTFFALIRSCQRCPAKYQCRRHWRMMKARFDARIDHINPKRVCIHIGFCNKTVLCEQMGSVQEECEDSIESKVPTTTTTTQSTKIDDSNSTCILCEYIMNILSNYINRSATQQEIEENLEKVCDHIPVPLKNQCHEYVDNYGPTIIATLLQDFDFSTVCQKLNICTKQMKVDIRHITKADTLTCGICDYISTFVDSMNKRISEEKPLPNSLSNVCSHLSDEQKEKCQMIVHLFSPYFKQLELTPGNNFCKDLPICQIPMAELQPAIPLKKYDESNSIKDPIINHLLKTVTENESQMPKSVSETPQCTLCHYVISYLDAALKNNKSEEAIEAALEKVCTILPSKERTTCDQFVTTYGPVVAQMVAEMADPKTVCAYIGVCQASISEKPTQSTTAPVSTSTRYGKCIFGMKYWCASRANAKLCNAVDLCENQVWSKDNLMIT